MSSTGVSQFADKLLSAKGMAAQKLSELVHEILLAKRLITRTYSYSFEFSSRETYLYSEAKLCLLLIKEVKKKLPFLSENNLFLSSSRTAMRITVARRKDVVERYLRMLVAKMDRSQAKIFSYDVSEDLMLTGWTATGRHAVVTFLFQDMTNSGRNKRPSVNPFRVFLMLDEIVKFICNMARYAPMKCTLTGAEADRVLEFQRTSTTETVMPDDFPISVYPMYQTARMVRTNERLKHNSVGTGSI